MSHVYNINFTDATKSTFVINPNGLDASTSLKLPGHGKILWGEFIIEDLVHLMENFANSTAPTNPIEGQLWYDNNNQLLNVFDGTAFTPVVDETVFVKKIGDWMSGSLHMYANANVIISDTNTPGSPGKLIVDMNGVTNSIIDPYSASVSGVNVRLGGKGTTIVSAGEYGEAYMVNNPSPADSLENLVLVADYYTQIFTGFNVTTPTASFTASGELVLNKQNTGLWITNDNGSVSVVEGMSEATQPGTHVRLGSSDGTTLVHAGSVNYDFSPSVFPSTDDYLVLAGVGKIIVSPYSDGANPVYEPSSFVFYGNSASQRLIIPSSGRVDMGYQSSDTATDTIIQGFGPDGGASSGVNVKLGGQGTTIISAGFVGSAVQTKISNGDPGFQYGSGGTLPNALFLCAGGTAYGETAGSGDIIIQRNTDSATGRFAFTINGLELPSTGGANKIKNLGSPVDQTDAVNLQTLQNQRGYQVIDFNSPAVNPILTLSLTHTAGGHQLLVFYNGQKLREGSIHDYIEVGGNQIQLLKTVSSGEYIEVYKVTDYPQ